MSACGELRTWTEVSLLGRELPPRKAYLSLHKLVPVVVRKRSETTKQMEMGFFTSRPSTSRDFAARVSGAAIPAVSVPLTEEVKTRLKFRVAAGLICGWLLCADF